MPKQPNLEKKTEEEKRKRVDTNYSAEQINKLLVSSCQRQPFPQFLFLLLHCTLVDPGQRPASRFLQNPKTKTKTVKGLNRSYLYRDFPPPHCTERPGSKIRQNTESDFRKSKKNHSLRCSWIIFLTRLYF